MSQRREMQQLIALKRALEKDMGIEVDMGRYGLRQRLLRLARASEDPAVAALAASLEADPVPEAPRSRCHERTRYGTTHQGLVPGPPHLRRLTGTPGDGAARR